MSIQQAQELSHRLLGPIFHLYLERLDAHVRHLVLDQGAKALFVSRAGVRIMDLYRAYLKASGKQEIEGLEYLWTSRMMAAKSVWEKAPMVCCSLLSAEFKHGTVGDIVKALYSRTALPVSFKSGDSELQQPASRFQEFIWSQHAVAHDLRWELTQQSMWYAAYWRETLAGAGRVALIDSGWQGTIQRVLADAHPDTEFWGLYFGRSGFENSDRRYWDRMVGLAFENDTFDPRLPASAITLHRHLIESLLEPEAPSIERIDMGADGKPFFAGSAALLSEMPTKHTAPCFMGVMEYLQSQDRPVLLSEMVSRAQHAARELAMVLAYPTPEQALALGAMSRSADFGRSIQVDALLEAKDRFAGDDAERRIRDSLWPNGQAALEYSGEIAPHRQKLEVPGGHSKSKLQALLSGQTAPQPHAAAGGSVAVITRTMDRPVFLRRALRSVAEQTYGNYVHVIVCDGGDMEAVEQTVLDSGADLSKVVLVDNIVNRGMESASNIAIRNSESDYVVIHDDDDTWDPRFLQEMVGFLESTQGSKYGGAISHTHYISEKVLRDSIVEVSRQGYNDWVVNVQLLEMATQNMFAPIAFVFKRSMYEELRGFDERFPVLGDWDFNLRFLMKADIGVVPKKLAYYHHRDVGNNKLFGNSVIAGIDKHAEYNPVMRNLHLRQDGPLALVTAIGILHAEQRATHSNAQAHLSGLVKANASESRSLPSVAWEMMRKMSNQLEDRWNTIAFLVGQLDRKNANAAATSITSNATAAATQEADGSEAHQ